MGIFSGLSTPQWESPQEMWANSGEKAPLFLSAFEHGQARADRLNERNAEIQGANDIASHLTGLSPEEQRATITQHPGWAMSPITAPAIANLLNAQGQQLTMARNMALQDAATQSKTGETVLAGVLSDISRKGSWTDPQSKAQAWEVATKYPGLMDTPAWRNTMDKFDKADKAEIERQKLQDQLDATTTRNEISEDRLKLMQEKADAGSPAKKLLDEADNEDDLAAQAKAAGNTAEYQRRTQRAQALRESVNTHGTEETTVGMDDQGRPIVKMTKGGKPVGGSTVATESLAQQKIVKYENATQLLNTLEKNLKPSDVGGQGVLGEYLIDRGLAQLDPRLANKKRIANRDALTIAKESLMREVGDDRRFTAQDREDISNALPSNGAFESYANAIQRIQTVRGILADRARNYAIRAGEPIPMFAQSKDEIVNNYKQRKAAIEKAVQLKNLTPEDGDAQIKAAYDKAMDALTKYH